MLITMGPSRSFALNRMEGARFQIRKFGMAIDFLHVRPLEPEEREIIRQQIEAGFHDIGKIDPGVRAIIARNWPHLLCKLPPEDE